MTEALPSNDLKCLKLVVETGLRLEKTWPADPEELFERLRELIANLAKVESPSLTRLSIHEKNLSRSMSAKHLGAILVPFERLLGRSLRDDEFLISSEDRAESDVDRIPVVIIADNLRSAFNVGAIFRTAECFGVEEVLLTGYTATPNDAKTSKTSLGAADSIKWRSMSDVKTAVRDVKQAGYKVIALETADRAVELNEFLWPEKCAIIVGNERFGIEADLLIEADHVVRIPMFGKKNSLNVGISLGIALNDRRSNKASSRIGTFHSQAVYPYDVGRQGSVTESSEVAMIELLPGNDFEQALQGLEGFDRIWLIYRFHHNTNWRPMVVPPRGPRTKRGVFATRSPYRPNAIGVSCVELVRVEGRKIFVRSHDLLDGTPILDIKPYLPYADAFPDSKTGWLHTIDATAHRIEISEQARNQLAWLDSKGVTQIETFFRTQLTFDPLDDSRKRVTAIDENRFVLAYRTWRVKFEKEDLLIRISEIASGYTEDELNSLDDKYKDKDVHRAFKAL